MANRPKPTALKVLAGNPGKRPLNDREPDSGKLDLAPPPGLSDAAVTQWNRIAPMLAQSGVLKHSDRDLLEHYCECYVIHKAHIAEGKVNTSLLSQLRQMLNEMGMTPAARSRIVADKPEAKSDGKARFFG